MIEIEQLCFRYPTSGFKLVIDGLQIGSGEKVAIVGPSGSGKTTLLNLMAGITAPDSGRISIFEDEVSRLSDSRRRDFRISNIGMVFQQFELVEYLNSLDNILIPFFINSTLELNREVRDRAEKLAASMGLQDKLQRPPGKLSQGEQQRVAICRALITEPKLILADEPTGNLDPANKTLILDILFDQVDRNGQTLVLVTHDMSLLQGFDRTIDFAKFRYDVGLAETSEAGK